MSGSNTTGLTVGPYVVGARLGIGGMGEVFTAVASGSGTPTPVALKLLLPHLAEDPSAVRMFLNEARLVAQLTHENVVRVLDVGAGDGRYYLAMELVRGVTLSAVIHGLASARRSLSPVLALYITRSLCRGLHHAHEQRGLDGAPLAIVHLDVSPQNVLVSNEGIVKLNDFGIAQAQITHSQIPSGRIRGKYEYLAPEQAERTTVDRRADLFGLAVTVAHAVTLVSPFKRLPATASLHAIKTDPFPDLSALRPDLDPHLVAALTRAAQKDPSARFSSAQALCDALPPSAPGCAEALGALVQDLCGSVVEEVVERSGWGHPVHTESNTAASGVHNLNQTRRVSLPRIATQSYTADLTWPRAVADTKRHARPPARARSPRRLRAAAGASAVGVALALTFLTLVHSKRTAKGAVAEVERPLGPVPTPDAPRALERESPRPVPEASTPVRTVAPVRRKPQPTPARPAAARERQEGQLTVDAIPWAEVFIDGKRIGETPIAGHSLEAGTVRVLLRNPSTGTKVSRTVTVRAGRETFVREDLQ